MKILKKESVFARKSVYTGIYIFITHNISENCTVNYYSPLKVEFERMLVLIAYFLHIL